MQEEKTLSARAGKTRLRMRTMEREPIVVDGSNIAYAEADGKPKVANLVAVCQALREANYEPMVIVDASLRHQVDDPQQLEELIRQGQVREAPAGTGADYFVLQLAEQQQCGVVSNDTFEEYEPQMPWIRRRRVPLMIIDGRVYLYRERLDRRSTDGQ